jgi:hypothetical protein
MNIKSLLLFLSLLLLSFSLSVRATERQRVIVTTDAEIDDECSLVRFLLYLNDFDVEAIISSSSQYHAHDHKWAGDHWYLPYVDAYTKVYPNLVKHDTNYPSPDKVRNLFYLGNVDTQNEMEKVTPGSQRIVEVLLDKSDSRPVWLQAWGGINTIARALKTIEEEYPDEMERVAQKMRLYLIWEQDETYQQYIRPHWGRYNILTIVCDQFITYFYHWKKYLLPEHQHYLDSVWMNEHILKGHGALCSLYKAHENGDFRSEGDSPAFFHTIPNGLRSHENPGWGGWGGRFVNVRENTWMDPVNEIGYRYPEGRWYTGNAWGRSRLKMEIPNDRDLLLYLKPMWHWIDALQNDFAARADWCVNDYAHANHQPIVKCNLKDVCVKKGKKIRLSAKGTSDPDGNKLIYRWWVYTEASSYKKQISIKNSNQKTASIRIPEDANRGDQIHVILEVKDNGTPQLTRYSRVVITVDSL